MCQYCDNKGKSVRHVCKLHDVELFDFFRIQKCLFCVVCVLVEKYKILINTIRQISPNI